MKNEWAAVGGCEKLHATNAGKKKRKWKWENPDSTACVCVCGDVWESRGENQRKSLAEKANVQCVCKKGVVVVIVSTSSLSFPLSIRLTHSAARLAHSQLQSSNVK